MGLFSRLATLIRSNINELINKAEDPEKMLNQVLVDMKQQLVEAKKQVAVAIADEKRIKKQYEQERGRVEDWEKKAMLAVKAGNDDLARAALSRKAEHEELARTLEAQWNAQKQAVDQLKQALRSLDAKIEEAKRKRNILVSRQKRAEAQRTINETLSNIQSTSAFDTFERMADRVTQLEAEAEASAELGGALPESSLESQFKALEAGTVDEELEALKKRLALAGGTADQKALPGEEGVGDESPGGETAASASPEAGDDAGGDKEPAISVEEIDAQLEELKRKLSED